MLNPFFDFRAPLAASRESDASLSSGGLLRSGEESALCTNVARVGVVVGVDAALFREKLEASSSLLLLETGEDDLELAGLRERLAKLTKVLDNERGLGSGTGWRRVGVGAFVVGDC